MVNVHHGDPATLGALFRGELWRGRGNLAVSFRSPMTLRELPSAITPIVQLAGLVMLAVALVINWPGRPAVMLFGSAPLVIFPAVSRGAKCLDQYGPRTRAGCSTTSSSPSSTNLRARIALVALQDTSSDVRRRRPPMHSPLRIRELRERPRNGRRSREDDLVRCRRIGFLRRYAVTVCYLRDRRDTVFAVDRRAAAVGVNYVEVWERHSFDFAIWPALRRLVRERRIDIVHSHDYKTNLYAWLLSRVEPIVPLATLHGYTGSSWRERIYYAPTSGSSAGSRR
jgi:hypothetical protein